MNHTALFTTEKKHELPILIVDKTGDIGMRLAEKLKHESVIVFVSSMTPPTSENIIHVPFLKKFPTVPDNIYSHAIIIDQKCEFHQKTLDAFLKKSKIDDTRLFIGINLDNFTEETFLNIIDINKNTKIGLLGDIFEKDKIYNSESEINKIISSIKLQGKIDIPGDGTQELSPVLLDDLIDLILEICFSTFEEQIYYITPKYQPSYLAVATAFKKINPDIKIDFVKSTSKKKSKNIILQGRYMFSEKYNLEERFRKVNIETPHNYVKQHKKTLFDRNLIFSTGLLFLITLLLLPFIFTKSFLSIGNYYQKIAEEDLMSGNINNAHGNSLNASRSYYISKFSYSVLKQELFFLNKNKQISDDEIQISNGVLLSELTNNFASSILGFNKVFDNLSSNPTKDFLNSTVNLKNSIYKYNNINQAKKIVLNKNISENLINNMFSTIDLWPELFGFNGKKKYLLAFVNNKIIRPAGGVIEDYAILTVSKGKIENINIYNTYSSDAKLNAHIEPPFPIRRYLPTTHWYLRDSGFNIDYSKSSMASAVFVSTEEKVVVDGVISFDINFIKDLLGLVGGVNVNGISIEINKNNLIEVLNTNKTDNIFKNISLNAFKKLSDKENIITLDLLEVINKNIKEKHLLLSFSDARQQAVFSENKISSAIIDHRQDTKNVINDYIGISESNLSNTSSSLLITRNLKQKVNIGVDGKINEETTLVYKNLSKDKYKNYLRYILPLNTVIDAIEINEENQKIISAITDPVIYENNKFKEPKELEVYKEQQSNKSIFGFLINIEPNQEKKVIIKYHLADKISLREKDYKYSLKIFKQPGVDMYNYNYTFDIPREMQIISSSEKIFFNKATAKLQTTIKNDVDIFISFSPK